MKRLILAVVLFMLASQCFAVDKTELFLIGATGADFFSTQGANNGREMNPVLSQRRWQQGLIMGGATGFLMWDARLAKKTGHPKAAKVIRIVAGAAHLGAAAWNIRQRMK